MAGIVSIGLGGICVRGVFCEYSLVGVGWDLRTWQVL